MRIALYTRVSTTDKGQTVENQFLALRTDCALRQEAIVLEEQDCISGTKQRRPGLDRLFAAAARREFDVLAVWSLDRLTREGAFRALEIIQQLSKLGIGFRSLQEPHFDTCGPFKDAIIAIAATLAKLEREKIAERVKAGLDRTRAAGTRLGRPAIDDQIAFSVLDLARQGLSAPQIARKVTYTGKDGKTLHPCEHKVRRILNANRKAA